MAHFLDESPFPLSQPAARELRNVLASTFNTPSQLEELLASAKVSRADVFLEKPARYVWFDVLKLVSLRDGGARKFVGQVLEYANASVAAAGCMTAMQNARGCEDASAIARYVRILPPSELNTFLSAFIEGKTGIYRGPEARTEKGKRALILMHLALASILEDHPMPGHGEVYDPKYHRRQAKLLTDEVFAGNKDLKVLFE